MKAPAHPAEQVLWFDYAIVEADVVNQAGPEGAGSEILSAADVQTAEGPLDAIVHILGHNGAVRTESWWSRPKSGRSGASCRR